MTTDLRPLVDVIVPAYNAARFLRPALDSALAQSEAPLRVIVIDDGSTDDTVTIARSYGPPVAVVSQLNKGLPGARNSGIAISTAPYLALLDADGIWRPGKLAPQVALLDRHPQVGLVFTDMTLFSGEFGIEEDGYLLTTPQYAGLARQPVGEGACLLPDDVAQALMRYNFSPEALEAIVKYQWPGNIRELENKVHRAVIMASRTACRRETPATRTHSLG